MIVRLLMFVFTSTQPCCCIPKCVFLQFSGWRRIILELTIYGKEPCWSLCSSLTMLELITYGKEPCWFFKIFNWSPGNPKKSEEHTDSCHASIFNSELLPEMRSVWHRILQGVSVCEDLQNNQRTLL